ncbi:MAG: hypothetical protein ETSY1_21230 [Candidatus Entotheonella factor]|uniref:Uncharacterized protein n=1 Tax=Entotheonella factor TaxID=1429438 RepID=W4LIA6_ENTF1|nr:MAG: hypothetical protein ETSY1_21230 [Candidatus Entotheonella factor]
MGILKIEGVWKAGMPEPTFEVGRPKQPIGLAHFLDLRVRAQNPAILGIPM